MSEHPGDNAINRFRAFWAGLLALVSFGFVLWIALNVADPGDAVEPGWAERGEARRANLAEITEAQAAVVSSEAVSKAMGETLAALKTKKAGKSEVVVPGSPTFLEQAQQAAEPAEPAAEGDAPAVEKPAEAKPAEEAAKPETPAAK